jgi:hypothetical protein
MRSKKKLRERSCVCREIERVSLWEKMEREKADVRLTRGETPTEMSTRW